MELMDRYNLSGYSSIEYCVAEENKVAIGKINRHGFDAVELINAKISQTGWTSFSSWP